MQRFLPAPLLILQVIFAVIYFFTTVSRYPYWNGLVAMFFCPFCTLCWANACTDLNPKLGGEPTNVISSAACTWCCPCCVISQDAESLDAATGAKTDFCGVSHGQPVPYPMHMHGGHPHQMAMY